MEAQSLESPEMNARPFGRWADRLCWIYAGLPAVVFFLGWVKWYVAVPAVLLLLFSFVQWERRERRGRPISFRYGNEKDCPLRSPSNLKKLALVSLLILA